MSDLFDDDNEYDWKWFAIGGLLIFLISVILVQFAYASHEVNHQDDPEVVQWYKQLRLMHDVGGDSRVSSCCGQADAYWCDDLGKDRDDKGEVQVYCKITDDRIIYGRTQLPMGTKIIIPPEKMQVATVDASNVMHPYPPNPTGHSIAFISSDGASVYCFVPGTLG